MIEIRDLTKVYGSPTAVDDLTVGVRWPPAEPLSPASTTGVESRLSWCRVEER